MESLRVAPLTFNLLKKTKLKLLDIKKKDLVLKKKKSIYKLYKGSNMLFLHPYLQEQNSAKICNEFLESLIINVLLIIFLQNN